MITLESSLPAARPTTDPAQGAPVPGKGLFRESAIARLSSPERLDIAAAVVRPSAWLILVVCVLCVVAAVFVGIFVKIPIKVSANGILLNIAGVKEVAASAAGQLKSMKIRVGDHVKAGDAIAQVEQPDLRQEIAAAQAELAEAKDQYEKVAAFQTRSRSTQDNLRIEQRQNFSKSIEFAEQRVATLTERLRSFEDLAERGIITKQRLLDARNEFSQAAEGLGRDRSSLKQLEVEEESQRNEREREQLSLSVKISAAGRKLAALDERMGRVDIVTSPYSGTVAEIKLNEGELVERGAALATIVPDITAADAGENKAPLVATLYVQPANGKKVRPGMQVDVLPSTVKREEHGYLVAKITAVSEVPATQEGMLRVLKNRQLVQQFAEGGAPFEVRAELIPNSKTPSGLQWSSSRGPETSISNGTPCKAEIVTRTEPVLQVLLPVTRQFFEMAKRP